MQHKACLVTRGFQDFDGTAYEDTFAPIVKFFRCVCFLQSLLQRILNFITMDGKTTYLNGVLSEALFTDQPEGIVHCEFRDHECNLVKALYGLVQIALQ